MESDDIRIMRVSNGWVVDGRSYRHPDQAMHGALVAETPEALVSLIREWAVASFNKKDLT